MSKGFWDKLPRPFFTLAPMYDVTDAAFRQIIVECGKPHVFFTEFVSTDGLCSLGCERLMHHLKFNDNEHPIVAQIFGNRPEKFYQTAKFLTELGFDGIDINMGCPDKNIIKQGSCAALFKNPKLAQEIILATKAGASFSHHLHLGEGRGKGIPVSVKIRIGDTKIDWKNWIASLLECQPAAISIHLRTRKEMSKVPAHWEEMPKIVKFIHERTIAPTRPLIIGNGDAQDLNDAKQKAETAGCDGIMLGRAIFQNPWLFAPLKISHNQTTHVIPNEIRPRLWEAAGDPESMHFNSGPQSRLTLLLRHARLFEQNFKGIKPFDVFKRFIKIYINAFEDAAGLREKLYKTNSAEEIERILKNIF